MRGFMTNFARIGTGIGTAMSADLTARRIRSIAMTVMMLALHVPAPLKAQTTAPQCNGSPSVASYGMTYDSDRRLTIIFGGETVAGSLSSETWGWDGTSWTCVAAASVASPSPRGALMLAYDARVACSCYTADAMPRERFATRGS